MTLDKQIVKICIQYNRIILSVILLVGVFLLGVLFGSNYRLEINSNGGIEIKTIEQGV